MSVQQFNAPQILGQPSNARSYHTRHCRQIRRSDGTPKTATQSLIQWHGLEECQYCSGEYETTGAIGGLTND